MVDYAGRTALSVAASQGNLEAVQFFISNGADLSISDLRRNDPIDDAVRSNMA